MARESVPAPTSNRRKSNALFLLAGQKMNVVGMRSDARWKGGIGGGGGGYKGNFFQNIVNQCTNVQSKLRNQASERVVQLRCR